MKIEIIEEKVEKYKVGDKVFTDYNKAEKYKLKLEQGTPHKKYFDEINNFRNKLEKYIYDSNGDENHDYDVEFGSDKLNYCSQSDDCNPIFSFGYWENQGHYNEELESYFFVDEENFDNITQEIYDEFLNFKHNVKVYKITRKEIKI